MGLAKIIAFKTYKASKKSRHISVNTFQDVRRENKKNTIFRGRWKLIRTLNIKKQNLET
jgi:hypothetical protein